MEGVGAWAIIHQRCRGRNRPRVITPKQLSLLLGPHGPRTWMGLNWNIVNILITVVIVWPRGGVPHH